MASISGIAGVEARIATIRSRLGTTAASGGNGVNGPLTTEVAGPADPTAGFDPFGAAYVQALDQAGIVAVADRTDPASGMPAPQVGSTAPVTGPPGDGSVATFSPAEFAGIEDGTIASSIAIAAPTTSSGAPAPWSAAAAAAAAAAAPAGATAATDAARSTGGHGFADPRTSTAIGAYATATPSSIAAAPAPSVSSGTSSSLVDSIVLSGPVYTGNASRAISAYTSVAGSSPSRPGATSGRYTGYTGVGSSVGKVGGYGAMPVPPELRAHGNGQVPASALEPIGQGGHRLYAPAAEAWKAAVSAARAEGISLTVTDTYRSYDQQVDLAARKGLYADGGYAAVPGTSIHGWGLAVDANVNDPATLAWMKSNAYRFGFVEAVPREPWHWEFRPDQA